MMSLSTRSSHTPLAGAAALLFAVLAMPTNASAQNVLYESLSGPAWTLLGGSWTLGLPEASSDFGQVTRLNQTTIGSNGMLADRRWFGPGTYQARIRFRPSSSGVPHLAPVTLSAILGPVNTVSATASTAAQTATNWALTPPLTFTLTGHQLLRFRVSIGAGATNYDFDSLVVDRVSGGSAIEMVGAGSFNAIHPQYYATEPTGASHTGDFLRLTASYGVLSWLQILAHVSQPLPAGSYRASWRLRKTVNTIGRTDLTIRARDSATGTTLASVTMPASSQPIGAWVDSPEVVFTLATPTSVVVDVYNTTSLNQNYEFLTMTVSDAAASYETFGPGCSAPSGTPALVGTAPQLGQTFDATVTNLPPYGGVILATGYSRRQSGSNVLPFDLYSLGAPGCMVMVDPEVNAFLVADAGGTAQMSFPIPNDPSFVGWRFYNQAFSLDPSANTLGLTVSNAGRGVVGY